jgi:2-oxoglutarate ferredoxin oxidoreductase subunit alpha
MLENLGYAIMTETLSGGGRYSARRAEHRPSYAPAQGDVMQARWGASGDYEMIVLSPWSVPDLYWQTIPRL